MKKFFIVVLILAVLISSVACARDTRIELSGLELKEVSEWTKRDWTKATDEERIEALYLLIDENNEDVDAGTSAIVSVDGFTQAFEGADENTTLGQIFAGATYDEVTFEKDELLPSKTP